MKPIVVAPFANSDIRDWPLGHFQTMIGQLIGLRPETVHVVGAPGQAIRARDLVRPLDPARVVNDCGKLDWQALNRLVRGAGCVIGNNSGIAHLAALAGIPTICIFGGAHQRGESAACACPAGVGQAQGQDRAGRVCGLKRAGCGAAGRLLRLPAFLHRPRHGHADHA